MTPTRTKLPDDRFAVTRKFEVGGQEGYFNVGYNDAGEVKEIFIFVQKRGSITNGLLRKISHLLSWLLQLDVPLSEIIDKLKDEHFEPSGITNDPSIPTALSILDYIGRWLENHTSRETTQSPTLQ